MVTKRTQYAIRNTQYFKGKRILITAGPTQVPIDDVRVISNIATGETGILLAYQLTKIGAKATLVLGSVNPCCINKKIRIINFRSFDELREKIIKELCFRKYDIIIHSAAVSDFRPKKLIRRKINSGRFYNLKLVPLPKIIRDIRHLANEAKLVMFKLESGISDKTLIKRARESLITYRADLVIANRIYPQYKAFILDEGNIYFQVNSKKELVKKLVNLLSYKAVS